MNDDFPVFIDTNIIVYAYDKSEERKRKKCRRIVKDCFEGKKNYFVSNQVLAETASILLKKLQHPLPPQEVREIIEEFNGTDGWKKISYSHKTIESALLNEKASFWDSLIAETMKENRIFEILTENTKDFKKINGIEAKNPLK